MIRRFTDLASREPGSVLAGLFALAFAAYYLAGSLGQIVVYALQQHVGGGELEFHIGRTRIDYTFALQAALTLGLVGLGLYWGYRLAAPATQTCPECLSEIPRAATICRYCTSQVGEVPEE